MSDPLNPRAATFLGGQAGAWRVIAQRTLRGEPIETAEFVDFTPGMTPGRAGDTIWTLSGVITNDRYTNRAEKDELVGKQAPIGRPQASCAALILLRKNDTWWAMTQEERRRILEEESHHIAIGMRSLPSIARRLYHCRDLLSATPFDFLGWLDYAPADAGSFDEMLEQLRASREWTFIDREIDIRLVRTFAQAGDLESQSGSERSTTMRHP